MDNLDLNKKEEEILQSLREDFEDNRKQYGEGFALAHAIKSLALYLKLLNPSEPFAEEEFAILQSYGRFIHSHIDEIGDALVIGTETKGAMLSLKRLTRLFSTM